MAFTRLSQLGTPGRSYAQQGVSGNILIFVPSASLSITSFTPSITLSYVVNPSLIVLHFTPHAPTVVILNKVIPAFVPVEIDTSAFATVPGENEEAMVCSVDVEDSSLNTPFRNCDYT